jgi:hypothetical protein
MTQALQGSSNAPPAALLPSTLIPPVLLSCHKSGVSSTFWPSSSKACCTPALLLALCSKHEPSPNSRPSSSLTCSLYTSCCALERISSLPQQLLPWPSKSTHVVNPHNTGLYMHRACLYQVNLVGYQHLDDASLGAIDVDFVEPHGNVLKGFTPRHVIHCLLLTTYVKACILSAKAQETNRI